MPDTRFFSRQGPFSLGDLAERTGTRLSDPSAANQIVQDVAPLATARDSDLSFLDNKKYRDEFHTTKAGACFVSPDLAVLAPSGTVLLLTTQPYKAYARAAQLFYPEARPKPSIAQTAQIGPASVIQEGAVIEDHVVIGGGVTIGRDCWIEANAVIGAGTVIGDHCRIGANASVTHALIGNHVRIYPGARIGQDGFGFAIDPSGYVKVPQLGRVIVEDHVEIGANTCIDRGAGPDTVIGAGTWIDNLVQIGHNVRIGKGCIIVAQCGVSGSTVLEDYVVLAGQAGLIGHLHIGKGVRVGAQSGVMKDVPAGQEIFGSPSLPIKQHLRQIAVLRRLTEKGRADKRP
jgi:UDP-3-O-[3-hydroxymyristoyl] glucosamine N-acyltransferase